MEKPIVGKLYQHKNGNVYKVVLLTNENAQEDKREEYPICVVYQGMVNGFIWSRTLSNWERSFKPVE